MHAAPDPGVGHLVDEVVDPAQTAPALMQCAHGYSGCIGMSIRGSQPASSVVASLPSMSPFRIAVSGRQKL